MKKQAFGIFAALFLFAVLLPLGAYASDVYAILYEDGELVFQHGDTVDSGKTAVKTYEVDLTGGYTWDSDAMAPATPWRNERESIRVVNFADKISPTSTAYWLCGCSNLERMDNIKNLDTASVTNMSLMFAYCSGLTAVDASRFDTAKVTSFHAMFADCSRLAKLDVSGWNTSSATDMGFMFSGCGCNVLTELDVSGFNTANVTDMGHMFRSCSALAALDVSHFDTANVTSMKYMFYDCSGLMTLDASHLDTANVKSMEKMFSGCSKLETICASDKFTTASVEYSEDMFNGCTSLVGGNGTKYDESHINRDYARIDTLGAPGYFTAPYTINAAELDAFGNLSVTLTNPNTAIMAASYFDANGKFTSLQLQDVPANAGTVTLALSASAKTARVTLLDSDCRPLCAAFHKTFV